MPHAANRGDHRAQQYPIELSSEAMLDIDGIFHFIAQTHPINAGRYVDRIAAAIEKLRTLPRARPRLEGCGRAEVRYTTIGSHRVIFRVRHRPPVVRILRILDARSTIAAAVRSALRADARRSQPQRPA
jgi:plasmid stabilization system protein ParE